MAKPVSVLIVDDHALVRKGLAALLNVRSEVQLVGEANGGREAVRLAAVRIPDVILMDLEMPGFDGIEAIRQIQNQQTKSKILVLSSYSNEEHVIAAVKAGVRGYLLKTAMPEELLQAILDVNEGKFPMDPSVVSTVVRELNRLGDPLIENPDSLTPREIEVIKLIATGHTNQSIAGELLISDRTVSTHVSNILKKLRLGNRTQIALYAIQSGLVDLNQ